MEHFPRGREILLAIAFLVRAAGPSSEPLLGVGIVPDVFRADCRIGHGGARVCDCVATRYAYITGCALDEHVRVYVPVLVRAEMCIPRN